MAERCLHHDDLATEARCPLQQLADHTITVTEARMPTAGVVVIILDRDDPDHQALGFSLPPELVAEMFEDFARRIREQIGGRS